MTVYCYFQAVYVGSISAIAYKAFKGMIFNNPFSHILTDVCVLNQLLTFEYEYSIV